MSIYENDLLFHLRTSAACAPLKITFCVLGDGQWTQRFINQFPCAQRWVEIIIVKLIARLIVSGFEINVIDDEFLFIRWDVEWMIEWVKSFPSCEMVGKRLDKKVDELGCASRSFYLFSIFGLLKHNQTFNLQAQRCTKQHNRKLSFDFDSDFGWYLIRTSVGRGNCDSFRLRTIVGGLL